MIGWTRDRNEIIEKYEMDIGKEKKIIAPIKFDRQCK